MVNSIEEFKGLVSARRGVARPNLFRVKLPSLPGATSREMNILCKDVQLPGRQIITNERRIGLRMEKIPYGYAVGDVTMTFHVLNDYGVKEYFDTWQNLAVNQETYEVGYQKGPGGYAYDVTIEQLKKVEKIPAFLREKNFGSVTPSLSDLDIVQDFYGLTSQLADVTIYKCVLQDAYPTSVAAIPLNNELDGITELQIQLSYTNWKPLSFFSPTNVKQAISQQISSVLGVFDFN